jgi:glycine/D-amino acid oxidase-like deaminating enzyme
VKEYPYWRDSSAPRAPHPHVELPLRADVVIVGAGYTGLAAARCLARAGASAVVLERERVGSGASSRNGGQVLTGLKIDPGTLVARFGESRARALFDASLDAIVALERVIADERMDCEYERTGHIQAASKPSHFEAFREEQALLARVFNHRVVLVPASEQHAEIGSKAYHGLSVDERSGALNPAKYVDQLAAAACRAGAAIVEDTPVLSLSRKTSTWTLATPRGELSCDDVLIATNGYTTAVTSSLQRRLVPIGSYIIATDPLTPDQAAMLLPKRRMAFDSKHFLHYFRLTRDNRLLFGGRAEFSRPTADTTRRCAEILRRDMLSIFPSLADARIDYAWGGNVAFTRDQLPHAGRLDDAYYAAGYGGHGVAMASSLGEAIARRIAGAPVEHPLLDGRFPAIPLYRGTPWFLPLAGAYYRLLDWLQ